MFEKELTKETVIDITSKKDAVIVCDWDGVMQASDIRWCENIATNREVFEEYFDIDKLNYGTPEFFESVIKRDEYYMEKWLNKTGEELPQEIMDLFLNCYLLDEELYLYSHEYKFSKQLLGMIMSEYVSKVYFLSHSIDPEGDDRKKTMCDIMFQNVIDKVEFVSLPTNISKGDWIKENAPTLEMFIDDRTDIIEDVFDKCDNGEKGIDYLFPVYGYNTPSESFIQKIGKTKSTLHSYENKIIIFKADAEKEKETITE